MARQRPSETVTETNKRDAYTIIIASPMLTGSRNEDRRSEQVEERAEAARKRTQTYVTERSRNRDKEMRRLYDHHRVPEGEETIPLLHGRFVKF